MKVLQNNTSIQDVLYNCISEYLNGSDDEGVRDAIMDVSGCLMMINNMTATAKKSLREVAARHNFAIISSEDFVSESDKNKKE